MKPELKNQAVKLRQKGFSLSEISKTLYISKSTASLWVSHINLSKDIRKLLEIKRKNGITKARLSMAKVRKDRNDKINLFADKLVSSNYLSSDSLLLILSMIYYCEGVKNDQDGISFTNSDSGLLSFFVDGCRRVFDLDEKKWRVNMHLHFYHNENEQLKFWSKTLRIPISQFRKTFQKENKGLYPKDGYNGCVRVKYGRSEYSKKLLSIARKLFKKGL